MQIKVRCPLLGDKIFYFCKSKKETIYNKLEALAS